MIPPGANEATQELIRKQMEAMRGNPIQPPQMPPMSPPMGAMGPPMGPPSPQMGPPQAPQGGLMGKFGGFFDNLDNTFQSPSKQLGLGLLGQINPLLAGAGLLAGGIFGGKR